MISLAFDHHHVHAAITTDGGDFVSAQSMPAPQGGYRDWLMAARDLVARLGADTALPVALAAPAIIDENRSRFSALAPLADCDLRRDLQSTLGRNVRCFGFGDCLAAWHAREFAQDATIMALWVGASCHGGVRANGHSLAGAHGAAGNWAHLQLPSPVPHELDGRPCWCGRTGCLETFLSVGGLETDFSRITGEHKDAAHIAAAAAAGDIVAESVLQVYEDRLGRATATMINLLDPHIIILGGATPLADRMCNRVPRKWPGYVQVDRTRTRLVASLDRERALLGGAARLLREDQQKD